MAPRFRILRQTALVPLLDSLAMVAADSAGLPLEPQNVEQGISNVEVTPFCSSVPCSVFDIQCLHASQSPRRGCPRRNSPLEGGRGVFTLAAGLAGLGSRFVQPFQGPEAKHRSRSLEQYSCQWRYAWKGKLDGASHEQRGREAPQTIQDPNWFLLLCIATHHGMPRDRWMGSRSRHTAFSASIRARQPEDNDGLL